MASSTRGRAGIEGLSALVTGGGSGIGLGAAKRLVADGAHVTICGRTEDRLKTAVDELSALGVKVSYETTPLGLI